MSHNLYHEAIAEAKQLKEMAEQNAKNKIIEAVSPRIKQLIEKQLLEEADLDTPPEELPDEDAVLDLDAMAPAAAAEPEGASISIEPDGEISLNVGGVEIEIDASGDDKEEELVLSQEVSEALATIVGTKGNSPRRLTRRLKILEARVKKLTSVMSTLHENGNNAQKQAAAKIFESLLREAVTLRRQVIPVSYTHLRAHET